MQNGKRKILWVLAAAYAAAMLYLLLFRPVVPSELPYRQQLRNHFNPIPFRTIRLFWRVLVRSQNPDMLRHAVKNLFGNILLFLPLGILPSVLWRRMAHFFRTIALATAIMTAIELLQMFLLVGTCDIDDIFLNVLGAAIGYWCYTRMRKR